MNKHIANWIKSSLYDLKTAGDYLQKTKELLKWLKKDKRLKIS